MRTRLLSKGQAEGVALLFMAIIFVSFAATVMYATLAMQRERAKMQELMNVFSARKAENILFNFSSTGEIVAQSSTWDR